MINFLLGRQTDPLQDKMLTAAVKHYRQHPQKETFVIVPNHIKFTTEVRTMNYLAKRQGQKETAVKNLHVLSFSRLAWFFLKDAAQGLPTPLDDAASAMLLSRIIKENKDDLLLFKTVTINSGLVKQLYQTILQIHAGNLQLDDLAQADLKEETKKKIHDLRIIYGAFMDAIAGRFSTKNEIQLQLNKLLAKKQDLQKASFFFSDFSHFTLQEQLTIKILMRKAENVTLAFKTKDGALHLKAAAGDYDYVVQTTIGRLLKYAKQQQLAYQIKSYPIAPQSSSASVLNAVWTHTLPAGTASLNNVQLVKADSRYAEAYFVVRTIYQQVALAHYRYRDFLVLAPDLHEYETYLLPIMRQNGVPYFNDLQQEMKYHPLVVLIENLANLLQRPLQTRSLLTILKTKLLVPDWYQDMAAYNRDVDELENFVLAHGINHQLWRRHFTDYLNAQIIHLDKLPEEVARIDKLRAFLVSRISKLLQALTKEKDAKKAVTLFFNFLTENGVAKRLDAWRQQASKAGDLQLAEQPEQLWSLLLQLLQDYLLLKPASFTAEDFFTMLLSAFKEATFSQIPSTLDAVNLSEIGMVQKPGYQQVFIIGATSTSLPRIEKTPAFLSSENLADLQANFSSNAYLEDQQQLNNLDQNYQFGLALSLARDRVYISYPVLNAANEQLRPSLFYERLRQAGATEMSQHDLPEKLNELLSFLTNARSSLGYLNYLAQTNPSQEINRLLTLSKQYAPDKLAQITKARHFDNQPEDIGPKLAQALYGPDLNSSVSQLETFYQNAYEYFLIYGLQLKKRMTNDFDVIQAGNYFHETFDRLVKELTARHLNLADIDRQQLHSLLSQARQNMQQEGRYQQLMNQPFNQYLFHCLDQTTETVANNWRQNLQETPLRAKYSELSFGAGNPVHGLNLAVPALAGNHHVRLRGKMDRVDLAAWPQANQVLAQVIDYKSSAKKFDLSLFYNGISLQMISYLDVLQKNKAFFAGQKPLALLGAFYQTITRQLNRLNSKQMIASDLRVKKDELDSQGRLMYRGIIASAPARLQAAEPSLKTAGQGSTLYVGLKSKKKGGFSWPRNSSFSDQELNLLLRYDEYLLKQAGQSILGGQLKLNPYRSGKGISALTYSDFRDIFFFDAMLAQNRYHEIKHMDKKELLSAIKKVLSRKEGQ